MATKLNLLPGGAGQAPPPSSHISRIISGSVGSIVYVLAFNPLEVVKIRQQTATAGSSSSPTPRAFLRGRGAVVLSNGLMVPKNAFPCLVAPQYGVVSSCPTNMCSRFFESTSRHIFPRHLDKPTGIFNTLLSISRLEGRAGLYAGLRPTMLAAVPNTAIYVSLNDSVDALVTRMRTILLKPASLLYVHSSQRMMK